jgi:hypothetical protein
MSRMILIFCLGALLASSGTLRAQERVWNRDALACADVGIDPGSPVFSQCVADLHRSLWAVNNLYPS